MGEAIGMDKNEVCGRAGRPMRRIKACDRHCWSGYAGTEKQVPTS
jgi:hypothetical protein